MGASHHGDFPQPGEAEIRNELLQRFLDQVNSRAKRNYSRGRIGASDEGDLAMAASSDREKNIVIIDFGKPIQWIGMPPEQANGLINLLMEKLRDLGVPATITV